MGDSVSYEQVYADAIYISGSMHHVKLSGLQANTTYYYRYATRLQSATMPPNHISLKLRAWLDGDNVCPLVLSGR